MGNSHCLTTGKSTTLSKTCNCGIFHGGSAAQSGPWGSACNSGNSTGFCTARTMGTWQRTVVNVFDDRWVEIQPIDGLHWGVELLRNLTTTWKTLPGPVSSRGLTAETRTGWAIRRQSTSRRRPSLPSWCTMLHRRLPVIGSPPSVYGFKGTPGHP